MSSIRISLHPAQEVVFNHPARFKVVAAGRRFGKTVLAVVMCLVEALKTESASGIPLGPDSEVVYIGTTLEQAKRNAWNYFKEYAKQIEAATGEKVKIHENTCLMTLPNGVRIRLLGMDNPDAARGMKIRFAVLDEYADMPDWVWKTIIRPALADVEGSGLFIGTPKGKNHFFELFMAALHQPESEHPITGELIHPFKDYHAFTYKQSDNPLLSEAERHSLEAEYTNGSENIHAQEIEAKFVSAGGQLFNRADFKRDKNEPADGTWKIAVDLAGFATAPGTKELKRRDKTAIAIVKIHKNGWWVKEIRYGQWDTRMTAFQIVKAAYDHECADVGIEKGALKNAVAPYLDDYMRKYNRYINIVDLTHGNKHKYDRVQWALQGRAQKGEITLMPGDWNEVLLDEAVDFPDPRTHDDLLDALAYIDQMASDVIYLDYDRYQRDNANYVALDEVSGY